MADSRAASEVRGEAGAAFRSTLAHALTAPVPRPFAARVFLLLLLIVLPLPLVVYSAAPAGATPPQPWTDENWYMISTSNTEAYNMGCTHGKYDASTGFSSFDILDFFGQNQANTGTVIGFGRYPVSYAQIEGLVENYALGYYECTGGDTSTVDYIGVGTNDSAWSVTTAGGHAWGHVVSAVENYVIQTNLGSQVVVWAPPTWNQGSAAPTARRPSTG